MKIFFKLFTGSMLFITVGLVYSQSASSLEKKVTQKTVPSIFQAWNPIDMPEVSLKTLDERLKAAAKHDLLWEEPISQLGYGVDLVLGVIWDNKYQGLATKFTEATRKQALKNKATMLSYNKDMVCLMEIRWRDAPGSYLPEDSKWWLRNPNGTRVLGWDGGPEPYYMLDYENAEFQDHIAKQAKVCIESGIYEGIMLDWSGHLGVIKKIKKAIGKKGLIIVNIHDDIEDGMKYKDYINGSFMELNVYDSIYKERKQNARNWARVKEALEWFESNLQKPRVNCLEVWGDRKDLRRMRATTALGLTCSDGYLLYADPNWLTTPDHLHDWYPFWDVKIGKPLFKGMKNSDGSMRREFENGVVVYNPEGNGELLIEFGTMKRRVSDGTVGTTFKLQEIDGDIFINK